MVTTKDGACWTRRTVTEGGLALYALADVCKCPEFVMVTLAELAERGIVGSADVLPMPVGPEPLPRTLDVVEEELTGVNLSLWEEEQTTARLRLEVAGRKAYGDRLKTENARLTAELHQAKAYIRAVESLLTWRTPFSPRGHEAVLLAIKWLLDDRNEYRSRVDGAEKEARLTRARIAALLVEPTDPQACALCSVPEDGHGVRVDAGGFGLEHEWTRPTDALVRERERMQRELERRAAGELPDLSLPWAHAMSDDDLHGFLDDLVSAALNRWRSGPDVPDRVTLAEIEKACAGWRTPGQGFRGDAPEVEPADGRDRIVAYRNPGNPRELLCREHGPRYDDLVPVTSAELPDGGICTYGCLSSLACGVDVLIDGPESGGGS
jgi:hypothetical protein